jgi:photosystem II stability/assembly factor-like uncharacterized protein
MSSGRITRLAGSNRAVRSITLISATVSLLVISNAGRLHAQAIDASLLAGMRAREIGPAGMSGRIAALDAVVSQPEIVYAGAATGGLWKSTNHGLTWEPIFDDQPVASIGAVAIFQDSPDIIWVGTGEGNVRNSVSGGNGIYRSLDGGKTWKHLGLEATERIHKIVLHPSDPDVAWAAALGRMWGENPERGVYKTTDGGQTWEKILYVDQKTGAADLIADPTNPNKLFAAMWEYRRWPWFFNSGGPGSGLYVTHDGGANWKSLTEKDGLPSGQLGRIGLGISRSNPETVYAIVEAEKSAVIRSDDGGLTWRKTNQETNIAPRPFYYARLWVDPERPDRVYNVASLVTVSDDGGRTFRPLITWDKAHPDHHAFWINPNDGNHLITGNDGGVYFSADRGDTWRFARNLPLAQFYHVRVDMDTPYHVYGGLQDNGSWKGPSQVWENGGIRNHHWEEVAFGDGFDTSPDPENSERGYAMSQGGNLYRYDMGTGEVTVIRPPPPDVDTELRFNWNAGFAQDPFDPATIYYGSQFVHRSPDRGNTWEVISPDLTTDNPEWQKQAESGGLTLDVTNAENFTTIITIAPSPLQEGVLWVGSDDGRLHVTQDGGATWTSLEDGVPDVPANTWIPHIEPSHFDAGTAYVVFDNHRRSDWTPFVFKTTDFGASWTRVVGEGDVWGYTLAIAEDPVEPNLLFLGTEFGLNVSLDGGQTWLRWTHGVPTVGVRDLVVHPREHDLVLGTHGRSIYILDDIRPLRTLSADVMASALHLFEIPDVIQHIVKQTEGSRFPGNGEYRGENRPYGVLISFVANLPGLPDPGEPGARPGMGGPGGIRVKVQVSDETGQVVRTFEQPVHRGVNRVVWNLRRDAFRRPDIGQPQEVPSFFGPSGTPALPGTYTVRLTLGEESVSAPVTVVPDPRKPVSRQAMMAKNDVFMEAGALQEAVADAITHIYRTRGDIDGVLARVRRAEADLKEAAEEGGADWNEDSSPYAEIKQAGTELKGRLTELEESMWVPPDTKGIVRSQDRAFDAASSMSFLLGATWDSPTSAQLMFMRVAGQAVDEALESFNELFSGPVADFRAQVESSDLRLMPEVEPLEVDGS